MIILLHYVHMHTNFDLTCVIITGDLQLLLVYLKFCDFFCLYELYTAHVSLNIFINIYFKPTHKTFKIISMFFVGMYTIKVIYGFAVRKQRQ